MMCVIEIIDIISWYLLGVCKVSIDLLWEGVFIELDLFVFYWKLEVVQYYEDGVWIEVVFWNYIYCVDVRQEEDSYEIFICYVNVICYIVCRVLQFFFEGWFWLFFNNGSIIYLVI